jgi:hypothetical protein
MKNLLLSLTVGFTVAISALVRAQSPQPESSATNTEWLGYNGGYDGRRWSYPGARREDRSADLEFRRISSKIIARATISIPVAWSC